MGKKILLIFLFLAVLMSAEGKNKHRPDSVWNDWHFRISPYFWLMGFNGTIYRPPQPTQLPGPSEPKYEIDVGFKDIKNSIKFAMMLAGKYRGKKVVTQFNFSSLILESEAITPLELVLQDIVLKLNFFAGDLGIGYRFIRKDNIELDGLIGLKFLYTKISGRSKILGEIPMEGARDVFWMDPVIGAHFLYRPHKRIELAVYADYGGGLFGAQRSYQVISAATYMITPTFHTTLGYRIWGVDETYEETIFTGHTKGWLVRFGFQF